MFGSLCCSIAKSLGACEETKPLILMPVRTIDIHEVSSILLDKLEEMGDDHAELYLADYTSRLYKKEDIKNFLSLDETDKIKFEPEDMDCDQFAGVLYGEFCKQKAFPGGIVDSHVHRLNWFIDENLTLWYIEPQTDKISRILENYQGWDIKFFLS